MTTKMPTKRQQLLQQNNIQLKDIHDLTFLNDNELNSVLSVLRYKHENDMVYTKLGARILLSVNPNKQLDIYNNSVSDKYLEEYKCYNNSQEDELEPHIYQFASRVYFHLRRSGLNQSIILNGDSGTGKTVNKKFILKQLANIRNTSKKEAKLYKQLQAVDVIFDSFGSASTDMNNQASRIGQYIEIQFDNRGRTVGAKFLEYLLDKYRVTNVPELESNFKIFYQLLLGSDSTEKQHFYLHDLSNYNYIKGTVQPGSTEALDIGFKDLRAAFKTLGFNKKYIGQIVQTLSSILHIGNIAFQDQQNQIVQEAAQVKNTNVLSIVADFLGIPAMNLESILTYKTKLVKKERCTIFLNATKSEDQRDELARSLFNLLISFIVEFINIKLDKEIEQSCFIGILDLPGFQSRSKMNSLENFCINYASERLIHYYNFQNFVSCNQAYEDDYIQIPYIEYSKNDILVELLSKPGNGFIAIMNKQANKTRGTLTDNGMLQGFLRSHEDNQVEEIQINLHNNEFTIKHHNQSVLYNTQGFLDKNMDMVSSDFVSVLGGNSDVFITNGFISGLFNSKSIATEAIPNSTDIISAQKSTMPTRRPSTKKRSEKVAPDGGNKISCCAFQFQESLNQLFDTFEETEPWFLLCLQNNRDALFDAPLIEHQLKNYNVQEMILRKKKEYTVCYQHDEFILRYTQIFSTYSNLDLTLDPRSACEGVREVLDWSDYEIVIGKEFTYLSDDAWYILENQLRELENLGDGPKPQFYNTSDNHSFYSEEGSQLQDDTSIFGSDIVPSLSKPDEKQIVKDLEEEKAPKTKVRKCWLCCTWSLSFYIPNSFLSCCGRMKLKEKRLAWREKFSLCLIIFFICACVLFLIAFLNPIICPTRKIYSPYDIQALDPTKKAYAYINGVVMDVSKLNTHFGEQSFQLKKKYGGKDISYLIPMQLSSLCLRSDGSQIPPNLSLQGNYSSSNDPNTQFHDYRYYMPNYNPDKYTYFMTIIKNQYKVGDLAYAPNDISNMAQNQEKLWAIINSKVYDLSSYTSKGVQSLVPDGVSNPGGQGSDFLDSKLVDLFTFGKGKDITQAFNKLYTGDPEMKAISLQCLNNVFYTGVVDDRRSSKCLFAQYILLACSIFLFLILFVKFLASVQFGNSYEPEAQDRFIILNVPCYTEGEESLRKTIESLALLNYDDRKKLLFIVSDGMVIGGGNDAPTPQIVLDILGADPNLDPEPLSFLSLGEGNKQHNMGKTYTGLYQVNNKVVPYLLVVKVGKQSERNRPGNRGKRDSQLILMRFFNKVHFDYPMTPMELEMYHQIKNIIGVDPSYYEFVLMVDADTTVVKDSLNYMVAAMVDDKKIMGLCGETSLANEKDSWATMIQVYEYYISHHLAKSFESLFGSVTCLPGCFCMYRLKTPESNKPLLISNNVVNEYSENRVDTLHKKNLLHLGEDRYLTTLMLKHFPTNKMTFVPDAQCYTNAPETWDVLLSQRRRWINSTVHNLMELVFLPRLCGFCCFSMRFVVFIDLFSTVIMPVTLGYLAYLIYMLIMNTSSIPLISLCFVVAPYALQMIVFILRRKWEHIGWMIIYLLALPVFAFFIPIYSFWHFDDFSWGNTRIVLGEDGKKKLAIVEEAKFDPKSIPLKKWSEFEAEKWEISTELSHDTKLYNGSMRNQSPIPHNRNTMEFNRNTGEFNRNTMDFNRNTMTNLDLHNASMMGPPPQFAQDQMRQSFHDFNQNRMSYAEFGNNSMRPASVGGNYNPNQFMNFHLTENAKTQSMIFPSPQLPSDQALLAEIRGIVSVADLMTVTKKQVRDELSYKFKMDLTTHREAINSLIERVLKEQN